MTKATEIKTEGFPSAVHATIFAEGKIRRDNGEVEPYKKVSVVYNDDEIIYNYYGKGGSRYLTHEVRTWEDEIKT